MECTVGNVTAILMMAMSANLMIGWLVVTAAHEVNPALRRAPQIVQFLAVVLWLPNIAAARWQQRRHRARWPRGD